jgi:hypothetical protein
LNLRKYFKKRLQERKIYEKVPPCNPLLAISEPTIQKIAQIIGNDCRTLEKSLR